MIWSTLIIIPSAHCDQEKHEDQHNWPEPERWCGPKVGAAYCYQGSLEPHEPGIWLWIFSSNEFRAKSDLVKYSDVRHNYIKTWSRSPSLSISSSSNRKMLRQRVPFSRIAALKSSENLKWKKRITNARWAIRFYHKQRQVQNIGLLFVW